ncbi:MAG: TonB-dependent receptor [Rhodocyclales bacterium]|nr:TonB-dependent receptor [Rhodocyclales bacterium]
MYRRVLATMGVVGASCGAFAEDAADGTDDYFGDFPVVLSASRLVQTVDKAPAAVTVIDREMIKASGARELVDVFRLVPGMVVGQYKGHQPALGFHGFTDPYFRQLQVLIDGVSVYSPVWGGADWSQLPIVLEDIERIEVVRGPNAAAFGANSFLGVVNIITRDPAVEHGGEAIVNFGENGIRDEIVRYAASQGDVRYRLTAGQRADHGLDSHPDTRRSNLFNMRGHFRMSSSDELRWQIGYAGGDQEQGVYSAPNHTDGRRTSHYDAGSVQLRWTHTRDADEEAWFQFSHAERSHREILPYTLVFPAPFGSWNYPLDFSYEYARTDIELQNTLRLADSVRGVWGSQARQDRARSKTYFASDDWQLVELYRLFGNLEWRPATAWIVAGGAMLEKNSITGTSVSPSLALNYEALPGHTLRVRAAQARRTPTLYEERFDWRFELPPALRDMLAGMGAPFSTYATLPLAGSIRTQQELDDERIRSAELSYLGQFPEQHLNVELHAFEHHLTGLFDQYRYSYPTVLGFVSTDPDKRVQYSTIVGFDNLDRALIKGQSMVLRWRPWSGGLVYLAGSSTNIRAEGPGTRVIESSGPQHTATVLVSQALPDDWRISIGYYRVGTMAMLSGGDALPATERIDVGVARRFRLVATPMEVALIVQNANGGIPVFEVQDIDRRTAWLSMRIEY